jgi:hypothetical protein
MSQVARFTSVPAALGFAYMTEAVYYFPKQDGRSGRQPEDDPDPAFKVADLEPSP